MYPEAFDEVHVVSDLHLGGVDGQQIFKGGDILARFIAELALRPAGSIAFVVNGDFVDFLAEPDALAFDANGAVRKLDRIRNDRSFKGVFDAMATFVKTPGRRLVVVIGNHDIELTLPDVQSALRATLCGDDPAAIGRLDFRMDGCGFVARVGAQRIICVHGNDVDTWNTTDYEHLRRLMRDRQAGNAFEPWTPNAGSKMVIEVMNGIKRNYPFVDLLKPETEAVVPVLLAFDQTTSGRLRDAAGVAARLGWDAVKKRMGLLSESTEGTAPATYGVAQDPLDAIIRKVPRKASGGTASATATAMLKDVENMLGKVDPLDLLKRNPGTLGIGSAFMDWIRGRSEAEVMQEALEPVAKDKSFDQTAADDTFHRLDQSIAADFAYVVAGHTHLERSLQRRRGAGRYLNTGTWARLIRITPDQVADPRKFEKAYAALKAPTIRALDASADLRLIHRATVASIVAAGGSARGDIFHLKTDGALLKAVPALEDSDS